MYSIKKTIDENVERGFRLKKIREKLGFEGRSLSKFAEAIEYDQSNLSNMEKGKKTIPLTVVEMLFNRHNVSANWLLFGQGEIFMNTETNVLAEQAATYKNEDDRLTRLERENEVLHIRLQGKETENTLLRKMVGIN
jgi:transcriptional regulator with XRE-family HTH domain